MVSIATMMRTFAAMRPSHVRAIDPSSNANNEFRQCAAPAWHNGDAAASLANRAGRRGFFRDEPVSCKFGVMTNRVTSLAEEAEKLPVPGRIRLAVHLLASLHKPEPDIDAAWAEESDRRLDAYLAGETSARDADEVLAKYLKP
jgi:putative addiction module component (TIGR02574 family)